MKNEYSVELDNWFFKNKRIFPWRTNRTPYRVLVSEIMLQQTRADVVVPYYKSWLEKFPGFKELAESTEDDVIKVWEGLGYYSRARNLRNIAREVVDKYNGNFPESIEEILSFKGIGQYTAAAISHFSYNKRVLGADGNINRVIARFYNYRGLLTKKDVIMGLLDRFLPKKESRDSFEGLIELGATICGKKPNCMECPIASGCCAYSEGTHHLIPLKKKGKPQIRIYRIVFIIKHGENILVKQETKKLMEGLYEFPYIEVEDVKDIDLSKNKIEKKFHSSFDYEGKLQTVAHTFTRYHATLIPILCTVKEKILNKNEYRFISSSELTHYPFSSGHKRIVDQLYKKKNS